MTGTTPQTGTCHCGAVRVTIPDAPGYVNDCNCTLCSSHGVLWGYFDPIKVRVEGATQGYARADRAEPAICLHFCPVCGCSTHWTFTEAFAKAQGKNDRMGTNMRIFPPEVMRGVEIRFPDGRHWDWTGEMPYRRAAERG